MSMTLTDTARAQFRAWLDEVARPAVRPDACEREALAIIEERQRMGESLSYELGSRYTMSNRPELYQFAAADFQTT